MEPALIKPSTLMSPFACIRVTQEVATALRTSPSAGRFRSTARSALAGPGWSESQPFGGGRRPREATCGNGAQGDSRSTAVRHSSRARSAPSRNRDTSKEGELKQQKRIASPWVGKLMASFVRLSTFCPELRLWLRGRATGGTCSCGMARHEAACRFLGLRRGRPLSGPLIAFDELFGRQPDVLRDLAQQGRRDVAPGVKRNRRPATVGMAELLVGTFLPNFREAQALQKGNDLPRLEGGQRAHYATLMVWTATNSDSNFGSPSSRSMLTTSCRLA